MNDPLLTGAVNQRKRDLRRGLRNVAMVCAVALAVTGLIRCGPENMDSAGASVRTSEPTFEQWWEDEDNRAWYEFNQWYGANVKNAVWYHIRDEFGMGTLGDRAVQVATCESGLNPRAVSRTNDHGVFQINKPSWERKFARVTGVSWGAGVYHASHNAKFAKWLHDVTGGWSHWACAR